MTSYCSLIYLLIFLPAVILIYSVAGKKFRPYVLLAAGAYFFWNFSGKLLVYLAISILLMHHYGLWISLIRGDCSEQVSKAEKSDRKAIKVRYKQKEKRLTTAAVLLHLGILVLLKYSDFIGLNINRIFYHCGSDMRVTLPGFVMPLGISFYTMQALSYIFDVYRGTLRPDRNLGRLALYMSFFPQLMEGPISRYSETAEKLWSGESVTYKNLTYGMQRIAYGMMKKIVVADRLNVMVGHLFNHYQIYSGGYSALAAICYTIQLYMEFSGTMDIVIGSGEIFGVKLPENFRQPFASRTISEFWTRWHITLGAWFRDYVFYPVSMSAPMKKLTVKGRKKLGNHFGPLLSGSAALFLVWLFNGLWHGAAWHYIFFGLYHFAFILTGNIIEPYVLGGCAKLKINRNSLPYRGMQIVRTVIIVIIGELFFRADGLKNGIAMFRRMVTDFSFDFIKTGGMYTVGMEKHDYLIIAVTVMIVALFGLLHERGVKIRDFAAKRNIVIRWALYLGLIMYTVIFGAYGLGYIPVDPIYAQF